ncbi:MAG: hypothetical protein QGH33_18425, partial [Pirellulaceae bacterium]|nr:hypothetical protein [Pirellulaceae bacterium]
MSETAPMAGTLGIVEVGTTFMGPLSLGLVSRRLGGKPLLEWVVRRVTESLLLGEKDGISWLPDVDFRIGKYGRVEFTHDGEDYYIQWMSPVLQDM